MLTVVYRQEHTLPWPDYFAGGAKWMASCQNFAITFRGHVNFLKVIRITRDRKM